MAFPSTEIIKGSTDGFIAIGHMSPTEMMMGSFLVLLLAVIVTLFFIIKYAIRSTTARIESLESDKEYMSKYVTETKESNESLIASNNELKSDRKLLHMELEKLTVEVQSLRQDYRDCLKSNMWKSKRPERERKKG